ncbi:MAG: HD domain-containing protein [Acidobacteria bacterium]|nr:HD domain-containing protein [Acidobacteriota bacterium]
MAVGLQGWTPETERSFKETLFRFLEEVNSTKSALYLLAPDGTYLLATQYGFGRREVLAARHEARSPVVLKAREVRDKPMVVNHRDESPELFDVLQAAGSERMLLMPLYGDSRLVGFVDARDKGRKRPFVDEDERTARGIAADLVKLVRLTGVVEGLGPDTPQESAPEEADPAPQTRRMAAPAGTVLDRMGLEQLYRCFVAEVSREPEIGVATLTMMAGSKVGVRAIVVEGLGADDMAPLFHHQADILRKKGLDLPASDSWSVQTVTREDQRREIGPQVVGASILIISGDWAVVGGVVGCAESGSVPRIMHRLCRRAHEISRQSLVRFSRNRLARGLLRPPGREFPHLEKHSLSVSRLTWLVAQDLGLSRVQCEVSALAGLLHDVGMVDLDYERLYRIKTPGPDERRGFRNHVVEGDRIVTEAGLGEINEAIRHHHERWDGRGYPDGLAGEGIPLLARIIHASEVWDVLTSPDSYRRPMTPELAVETMQMEGGRQFDSRVVDALLRVV